MSDRITVTAQDDQLEQIDDLANRLRQAGMEVEQVHAPLGVITGSVTSSNRASVEQVPGVMAIEDETSFQIPPPDADVQ
jgi:hypothetical protein